MAFNDRLVELLVDGTEESQEAKKIAAEFDPRIKVRKWRSEGDLIPVAFWCHSIYRGVEEIKLLKETLDINLDEGRI